ncbi:putative 7-deoxyloganetin glucosyltransferase [Rosa chinensis]|uniref:Glycosyltransferase n=1 Tax=Rosa chinensis TaxID=74649 RepID=A0A2P6PFL3_ROSCH|nr:7-deoxyloganetin glucosyltransferase [Rosa chinensis]PRQ20707.1 putative 7-deoxyloganetin glucosyltransferase [Rosa chinensis]
MGSNALMAETKPHAVCVPYPAQGHINPMLKLAKLLHHKGFHITFVNTEYNHKRLLNSRGPNALDGLPSFQFKTIPDGLPPTDKNATQDIPALCESTRKYCLPHFRELLGKLNSEADSPPVSCVVSDGIMSFTLDEAEELGVPAVLFWTTSACGFMCYIQYQHLVEKGYTPLRDASYLTNGYLNTAIDWIPGMKDIRLKDFPTFIRTTDPNDNMIDFVLHETERAAKKASAIILNTFDDIEHDVLEALSTLLPPVYSIGPLNLQVNQIPPDSELQTFGSNLWKEETEGLEWLDSKEPKSVVYVNFGSITVMTQTQLIEFAWGLANSKKTFLWVIRPDLVGGASAMVPAEFVEETRERSMLISWCPQDQVLSHPATGGFLTHSGWNSTVESVCGGVPMICWPFFAEQQTNCRYCCKDWGIGMEIEGDPKRDYIEELVRKLMEGEEGKEMKKKALEWKMLAMEAVTGPEGSSFVNLDKMVNQVLLAPRKY